MTGEEVEGVVDVLAEKLGLAVTELEPLAEETVRQVALRGIAGAIGYAVIALTLAVLAIALLSKAARGFRQSVQLKAKDGYSASDVPYGCAVALSIFAGVAALAAVVFASCGVEMLQQYLAPIPTLLGK